MKMSTTFNKFSLIAILICNCILFSCSENADGSNSNDQDTLTEKEPVQNVDSTAIYNWNNLKAMSFSMAENSVDGLGWYFMIDPNLLNGGDYVHVYAGLDGENKLCLYAINSENDTKESGLNSLQKLRIDSIQVTDSTQIHFPKGKPGHWISAESAVDRVLNWGIKSSREKWVGQYTFKPDEGSLNPLFSTLIIDVSDFKQLSESNTYACFLALKETYTGDTSTYSPDLIIVDMKIEDRTVNYMLEDVVHLIPPCSLTDLSSSLYPGNFGVLLQLGLVTIP